MKLSKKLLRESSYNRKSINRNQMDYGGFYHILYTSPDGTDDYFIFVVHPNLDRKTHCLDLGLIEDYVFDDFFAGVRMEDDVKVAEQKEKYKGYVKRNIRIGPAFYKYFIKRNRRLMEDYPYKTLISNKIHNVRYIEYDI